MERHSPQTAPGRQGLSPKEFESLLSKLGSVGDRRRRAQRGSYVWSATGILRGLHWGTKDLHVCRGILVLVFVMGIITLLGEPSPKFRDTPR